LAPPTDHKQFLDNIVAVLNQSEDDDAGLRALATPDAFDVGNLKGLWRLRRDKVVYSSAGVLSAHGPRTLGCVRYERPTDPSKPARSAFALLLEGEDGFKVAGIYEEIPLALAWLRGWITAGQKADALPSDDEGKALAEALVTAPHGGIAALLCERIDADPAVAARADGILSDGPATVLGVHALTIIGRTLIGIGVGHEALWLVLERDPKHDRPHLVSVLIRPSLAALVTGARAYALDTEKLETDLFLERLLAAVRGRAAAAKSSAEGDDDQRERFREELTQRLNASFGRHMPADEAVVEALKATLQSSSARAKTMGELVAQVLGHLAGRT